MKKIYLILITAVVPVFAYTQAHEVNLRLILNPIQILEVHSHLSAEFSKHPKEDSVQVDVPSNLNTYSTSNFVLNVQVKKQSKSLSRISNNNILKNALYLESAHIDLYSSPSEDEILKPSEEDFDSHLLYSMEVL